MRQALRVRAVVIPLAVSLMVPLGASTVASAATRLPSHFVKVGTPIARVSGSAERYFAFTRSPGSGGPRTVRVLDTKTMRVRTLHLPRLCSPEGDGLQAGAGRLLLQCRSGSALMSLRTGRVLAKGLHPELPDGSPWLEENWNGDVGERWMSYGDQYRNIRTGVIKRLPTPQVPSGQRNLDDPRLSPLTFCAPFSAARRFGPRQQVKDVVLVTRIRTGRLGVGQCGLAGTRWLTKGPATSDGSLSYGYTAWANPRSRPGPCTRSISLYETRTRRTTTWPRWHGLGCVDIVRHTKYAVIVGGTVGIDSDYMGSDPTYLYQLWTLRLPRR